MDKGEQIRRYMEMIKENEILKEVLLGIANNECASENINDIEERNDLFIFLGTSLALLAFSKTITLNDSQKYTRPLNDKRRSDDGIQNITKNKALDELVVNIVKHETEENKSKVRNHVFLITALSILSDRNMISINTNQHYESPF